MDGSVWVFIVVIPLLVLVSSLLFLFRGLIGEDSSANVKHQREENSQEKPKRKKKQKGTTPTPTPDAARISMNEKRVATSDGQQKGDKKEANVKEQVGSGEKSKSGEKKKKKAKNKEKREETLGTTTQDAVAVTEEEQAPGEWKETVSRKTKRERKVQLQKEQQPAVKEETAPVAAPVAAPVDIITDKKPDEISDELLKAAATDDLVGSTRESSGRASAGASSNSNPDLSDFVHIEMRSGEACEMSPEVVDSSSDKKKPEETKPTGSSVNTVAGQDATDSIREGSAGATAKPQRQKKRRKRKSRPVGGGDEEDDEGEWEVV